MPPFSDADTDRPPTVHVRGTVSAATCRWGDRDTKDVTGRYTLSLPDDDDSGRMAFTFAIADNPAAEANVHVPVRLIRTFAQSETSTAIHVMQRRQTMWEVAREMVTGVDAIGAQPQSQAQPELKMWACAIDWPSGRLTGQFKLKMGRLWTVTGMLGGPEDQRTP